jgi:multicomponent Na+:H+ antiporter subunit E
MSFALLTFVIAIGWAVATGNFTVLNLLFGAVIGAVALLLIRDRVSRPRMLRRFRRILSLALLFVYELLASALRVAVLVLRPNVRRHLKPAIVAFPLRLTRDAEITLLANLITLTPGTLSVDVSSDRSVLFVHAIDLADREALIRDIANGFEQKIIEAFE